MNTPAAEPQFSLGLPVEIGRIDHELKKLWTDGEGAMTRASLMNLVVYSEEAGSLARNTQLVSELTENHACRAIVVAANRKAKVDRAEAWISAHCHVHSGAKQVCSEQISFLLEGARLLPSIVFSQLDSDLPLYLWWQSEFAEPMDAQLWAWVDRLIYDSQAWRDFDAQMRLVETAQRDAKHRIILCDLNWTRLVHFRLAFAQFFDPPASHHHFREITAIALMHARGYRSTALLFLGWLASQLDWEVRDKPFAFQNRDGKTISIALTEAGEFPLSLFTAHSGDVEFRIARASCGDLLEVGRSPRDGERSLLPASDDSPVKLMSEELMRGGSRQIYRCAVEKMRGLL
ncbi:MAG: glucose-6-phosphate dehydrogenase assembly protein OpcA [Verrucomicrobiota bacterium]|nr:glucose-6-phosphate dehydrogenase assembly protein OpcA [Verrucomicrobiota bacterium]